MLEGGFPCPSSILLIGPVGVNKNTIAQHILWTGLVNGEKCMYVTFDSFPKDIIENMRKYSMDVEKYVRNGQLVFIDGFSSRVGFESDAEYVIENPFNVREVLKVLTIAESEVFDDEGVHRLVFSHLSSVIFTLPRKDVALLVGRIHAEARKYNGLYVMVYTEGIRDKYTENFIRQISDVVLRLERELEGNRFKRYLTIVRCVKTQYPRIKVPYRVSPQGVELLLDSCEKK